MILKSFFNRNIDFFTKIQEKKILNYNVYGKSFLRSSLDTINTIDSHFSFTTISKIQLKKINSNNHYIGSSINSEYCEYKNKLNHLLKFKSLSLNLIETNYSLISSFYNSLEFLNQNNIKSNCSLLVLKPKKGGYHCYSSGVIGFLPRSHGVFLFIETFLSLYQDTFKEKKTLDFNFLFNKNSFNNKFFSLRLLFHLGKVSFYPGQKKKNFSSALKYKKKKFLNSSNFVFLSKKIKKEI
jgi:ribosomal protein S1